MTDAMRVLRELELRQTIEGRLRRIGLFPERVLLGSLEYGGWAELVDGKPVRRPWPKTLDDDLRAEILDLERDRRDVLRRA